MSGDKLQRVKAVRKWLEKAEDSYSSHEEITGEINLIMAKAEMQRLDETHPHAKLKKWGLRACALAVAVLLFGGFSMVKTAKDEPKPEPLVPVQIASNEQAPTKESIPADENQTAVQQEPVTAVPTVSAAAPVEVHEEPPAVSTPAPAAVPAAPVLSAQEIQSVVGEAGRALRGEN